MKQIHKGKPPSLTREQVIAIRQRDAQGNYVAPASWFSRLHSMSSEYIRRVRRGEAYAYITEGLAPLTQADSAVFAEIEEAEATQIEQVAPPPPTVVAESLEKLKEKLSGVTPGTTGSKNPYLDDTRTLTELEEDKDDK